MRFKQLILVLVVLIVGCVDGLSQDSIGKSKLGNVLNQVLEENKRSATDIQMGDKGVGESKYDTDISPENVHNIEKIRSERRSREVKKYSIVILIVLLVIATLLLVYKKRKLFNKKGDMGDFTNVKISEEQLSFKDISMELIKLNELKEKGIITDEELSKLKSKILK